MNALEDSANTDRCTLYEDSANFLKDERFTKTEYQTSANLWKMNAEDSRITTWVNASKWGKTLASASKRDKCVSTTTKIGWCFPRTLICYSTSEYPLLLTDSPPVPPSKRPQTRLSYEQNGFPVCCRNKQRNFTIIKQAVSEIHEEGDEIRFRSFSRYEKLCLVDLNFNIDEAGENSFLFKMQIKSCATLFSLRVYK